MTEVTGWKNFTIQFSYRRGKHAATGWCMERQVCTVLRVTSLGISFWISLAACSSDSAGRNVSGLDHCATIGEAICERRNECEAEGWPALERCGSVRDSGFCEVFEVTLQDEAERCATELRAAPCAALFGRDQDSSLPDSCQDAARVRDGVSAGGRAATATSR